MRPERYSYSYASSGSGKSPMSKLWPVLLLVIAVVLLVMVRVNSPFVTRVRAKMLDVVSPVSALATKPFTAAQEIVSDKNALVHAFEENKKLKEENDALRHWQAAAQALKAENDSLRTLAGYSPVEQTKYVTARVIGQSPNAYAGTMAINAGANEGIGLLQPVIDSYGLVGRISELGERNSRVLLLSDTLSHVPVISADTRTHAILAGTGEELMRLTFVGEEESKITLGESIVTTEEGGLMPGGILIGTVFRRDKQGLLVKPVRPLAASEYVRVVAK